jgi:hypothetical protein
MAASRCHGIALRGSALLQLVVFVCGCTSWQVASGDPASLIASQKPSVVRVTQRDSSRVVLSDPTLQGDTVYGYRQATARSDSASRVGLTLADVLAVETRKSDPTRNLLLGFGVAVATFSMLCLADELGCGPDEVFLALGSRAR